MEKERKKKYTCDPHFSNYCGLEDIMEMEHCKLDEVFFLVCFIAPFQVFPSPPLFFLKKKETKRKEKRERFIPALPIPGFDCIIPCP